MLLLTAIGQDQLKVDKSLCLYVKPGLTFSEIISYYFLAIQVACLQESDSGSCVGNVKNKNVMGEMLERFPDILSRN